MKLLLTSGGISTRHIGAKLQEMAGKPASEVKIALIPTAANVEVYNKNWFVNQFISLWRYGFYEIDIVDPTAAGVDWRTRLADADIIYVSGGNTFHLLDQAKKTSLDVWLKENIEHKIYVGSSAGSILAAPTIALAGMEPGDENLPKLTDLTGLGLVDFELEPHCDAERFAKVEAYAAERPNAVYALDDNSAIAVIDDSVEVVSSGSWRCFE